MGCNWFTIIWLARDVSFPCAPLKIQFEVLWKIYARIDISELEARAFFVSCNCEELEHDVEIRLILFDRVVSCWDIVFGNFLVLCVIVAYHDGVSLDEVRHDQNKDYERKDGA